MRRWVSIVALALSAAGCATVRPPTPVPPVVRGVQTGVASWYGPGFHGRRTANGEICDQHELTAAHPSLPLGTRAIVTNLTNGRAVEVRINDRGPFVGGRCIDLSYAAARTIEMIGPGTAPVRVEVLGSAAGTAAGTRTVARASSGAPRPARTPVAPPPPDPGRWVPPEAHDLPAATYAVQVAALSDPAKAEHLRRRLALRFPDAFVSPLAATAGRYYRVRIGPYPLRGVAVAHAEMVSRLGYPAVIVEDAPQ
jgi:rare lipoprotein A